MRVTGFLVVEDPSALKRLGPRQVVHRCWASLLEVRGIDTYVLAYRKPLASGLQIGDASSPFKAWASSYREEQLSDTVRDTAVTDWAWASARKHNTDIAVIVQARCPLMTAARIEACLRHVSNGHRSAWTVLQRSVLSWDNNSICRTISDAEVRGCVVRSPVFHKAHISVPVDFLESLDVSDPEQMQLAEAAVSSGLI